MGVLVNHGATVIFALHHPMVPIGDMYLVPMLKHCEHGEVVVSRRRKAMVVGKVWVVEALYGRERVWYM